MTTLLAALLDVMALTDLHGQAVLSRAVQGAPGTVQGARRGLQAQQRRLAYDAPHTRSTHVRPAGQTDGAVALGDGVLKNIFTLKQTWELKTP